MIHDEKGAPLATANLKKPGNRVEPGIYFENKSGDLRISGLMVRRSSVGFDATKPSVQTLDEAALNGQVESFDGNTWKIVTVDKSGRPGPRAAIEANKFCGAFQINPSVERIKGQTRAAISGWNVRRRRFCFHYGQPSQIENELLPETDFVQARWRRRTSVCFRGQRIDKKRI